MKHLFERSDDVHNAQHVPVNNIHGRTGSGF
ncbi:MAG: hypothetical protein H6Q76_1063, partial [Firmicutes bacterium]|nr:hypothetical protein [Bacillota bacterium]